MATLDELSRRVLNPDASHRAAPFWAWNSSLEPKELRRQIRIFKEMGFGGFFMHSRVGLATPYLSQEWFRCVHACVEEAKALGMKAWLYDEDRWPSGAAGGMATKDDRFRARRLHLMCAVGRDGLPAIPVENILGVFEVAPTTGEYRRLDSLPECAPDGQELAVAYWQMMEKDTWFNGESYLDTMNPAAVRRFLDITHEAYHHECGEEFGKAIPGIFTDEPACSHAYNQGLPWTERLPQEFTRMHGYDLLPHLPELFLDRTGEEFSRVRHDFYETCTQLFIDSFPRQIGEWCQAHSLALTGHTLHEDLVANQRMASGAAMRFYEHEQIPGIDLLTEHCDSIDAAKQCASVARQIGRTKRLCEAYGCTGWDFPLVGHKAIGEWLLALGINFRVPHLAWYSMEGEAKRDYPASFSFHSPWWRDYHAIEDHFARLNAALDETEETRDLLVIHPIETAWGWKAAPSSQECEHYSESLIALRNALMREHLEFDYGDEVLMSRHSRLDGAALRVGHASYRAVLVPELATIRSSTLNLLRKFADAGGLVAYLGEPPKRLDAQRSPAPATAYRAFRHVTPSEFADTFAALVRRTSVISDGREADAVFVHLREGGERTLLFLVNTSIHHPDTLTVAPRVAERTLEYPEATIVFRSELREPRHLYELDTGTGKWQVHQAEFQDGRIRFDTSFAPLQSRLFLATASPLPVAVPSPPKTTALDILFTLHDHPDITLDEPNALVLDTGRCLIDGKESGDSPAPLLDIDDTLRARLGAPLRGNHAIQPWLCPRTATAPAVNVTLEFEFDCETPPPCSSPLWLALEHPEAYQVRLNGVSLENVDGWWIDPAIRRVSVPHSAVRTGRNLLSLHTRFSDSSPGLEALFLLGDFGVRKGGSLTAPPRRLELRDWCNQGLPCYAGNCTYHWNFQLAQQVNCAALRIPAWAGTALKFSLDGMPTRLLAWPPYVAQLGHLEAGAHSLDLTVLGSRRNAFGPFHCGERYPAWVGHRQFRAREFGERQLAPSGLFARPELLALSTGSSFQASTTIGKHHVPVL
ncbi:MAG: hypothetical protein IJJ33_17150 [Victivallales bacterium]|nr:hypothetical protein [Victivallales bacterium]